MSSELNLTTEKSSVFIIFLFYAGPLDCYKPYVRRFHGPQILAVPHRQVRQRLLDFQASCIIVTLPIILSLLLPDE